jgi:hypothetical protein
MEYKQTMRIDTNPEERILTMKKKQLLSILLTFLFMLLLLLFPTAAVEGSKAGLLLWFQVLIPTLLPYFILTSLLRTLLPAGKSTVLFVSIGLFSGFPVGAKMVGEEYRLGNLTYRNSIFLLSFCNQASSVFILSFIGTHILRLGSFRYVFLLIVLVSSCLGSFFVSRLIKEKCTGMRPTLCKPDGSASGSLPLFQKLDNIVLDSFIAITKIGGYVILFSVLAGFTAVITNKNPYIMVLTSGLTEVTIGANGLLTAFIPENHKIVLASVIVTFGGFSALAQTKSMISETGLSVTGYFICKLISAFFAVILSFLAVSFFFG